MKQVHACEVHKRLFDRMLPADVLVSAKVVCVGCNTDATEPRIYLCTRCYYELQKVSCQHGAKMEVSEPISVSFTEICDACMLDEGREEAAMWTFTVVIPCKECLDEIQEAASAITTSDVLSQHMQDDRPVGVPTPIEVDDEIFRAACAIHMTAILGGPSFCPHGRELQYSNIKGVEL